MAEACGTSGGPEGCIRGFSGTTRGKETTWKLRRRWEESIKMDIQEVGCRGRGLDRLGSGSGQMACTLGCGNEPSGSIKYGEFLD
jgi:hypothetical protein